MKIYYDLHIHSCLSPCGDMDMTPNNLVNMAALNGLQMIALTDHNSCKNCPAAAQAAREAGLIFVPGMELCTSEEAHVVCLFPSLEQAMAFDAYVEQHIPPIANRPEIFGQQQILNAQDEPIGEVEQLLISATTISVDKIVALVRKYGGAAFPAHIDKASYSVVASLGVFPDWAGFSAVEIYSRKPDFKLESLGISPEKYPVLHNSDAHYLENIAEAEAALELPLPTAEALIAFLNGAKFL
ncbi:MAG: PHP domain-containing protein [Oscillospiraceae bacterium]|jgi:PHP family Zn ribbon phosphoesterase|nr:PHP domain-containing protein [Oscillospiraceae bacterium]